MQFALILTTPRFSPARERTLVLLRASALLAFLMTGSGCYLFEKPATSGTIAVTGRAKRLKAAAPRPLEFPRSLLGNAQRATADVTTAVPSSVAGKFTAGCAVRSALYCDGRDYGAYHLQIAVLPDPAEAQGLSTDVAFGVERIGKKGAEWSYGPNFVLAREGHRVALASGPLEGAKARIFDRLRRELIHLVKPGGPDAGLEFLHTWRRIGIDRSKVTFVKGYLNQPDLPVFTTPIDAGELFYFEKTNAAKTIASAMQTPEFQVASGKRLIFTTEKYGEVQLILGDDWAMGVLKVEDPARAASILDSALYVPAEKGRLNYDPFAGTGNSAIPNDPSSGY